MDESAECPFRLMLKREFRPELFSI